MSAIGTDRLRRAVRNISALEVDRLCAGYVGPSQFDPLQTSAPDFRTIWSIEQGLSRLPPIGLNR